ncbi:MAG: Hsp20/alpha crystallin family protein [Deltaproteobacteria bacterium]|nr:Hsp20/alpha crystallin family protein [Deltaproteobacteria bacterium]
MNLATLTPWRGMTAFHDRVNRLFDDSFFRAGVLDGETGLANWNPVVDIYDKDEAVVIKAELPGMDKKDIAIDIKDGVLTLKGERTHDKEVKEEDYFRKERAFGQFQRAFKLPAEVDPEKVKADFKDGVLKIDIPKPEEKKPKKITVH